MKHIFDHTNVYRTFFATRFVIDMHDNHPRRNTSRLKSYSFDVMEIPLSISNNSKQIKKNIVPQRGMKYVWLFRRCVLYMLWALIRKYENGIGKAKTIFVCMYYASSVYFTFPLKIWWKKWKFNRLYWDKTAKLVFTMRVMSSI